MTPAPGPHLSPDDVELWLTGTLDAARTRHLELCPECLDRAQAEREIVEQLAALPLDGPSLGFEDRVMAAGHRGRSVRAPLAAPRSALFASRRSMAIAASLALALVGLDGGQRRLEPGQPGDPDLRGQLGPGAG